VKGDHAGETTWSSNHDAWFLRANKRVARGGWRVKSRRRSSRSLADAFARLGAEGDVCGENLPAAAARREMHGLTIHLVERSFPGKSVQSNIAVCQPVPAADGPDTPGPNQLIQ